METGRSCMQVWKKYALIQLPGWALIGLILLALQDWVGLPAWVAAGLFLLYVAKDVVIYPSVRSAYESSEIEVADQLIGAQGIAKDDLDPEGYIQLRGELWRARAEPNDTVIGQGSRVEVQAAEGLILIVTIPKEGKAIGR